jgi:predicted amidohydrolase
MSEFESNGKIHIIFDDLVGTGANWITPARLLKVDIIEFLTMLQKEYDAELTVFRNEDKSIKFIDYKWSSLAKARAFKNKINAIAREQKFTMAQYELWQANIKYMRGE